MRNEYCFRCNEDLSGSYPKNGFCNNCNDYFRKHFFKHLFYAIGIGFRYFINIFFLYYVIYIPYEFIENQLYNSIDEFSLTMGLILYLIQLIGFIIYIGFTNRPYWLCFFSILVFVVNQLLCYYEISHISFITNIIFCGIPLLFGLFFNYLQDYNKNSD